VRERLELDPEDRQFGVRAAPEHVVALRALDPRNPPLTRRLRCPLAVERETPAREASSLALSGPSASAASTSSARAGSARSVAAAARSGSECT
jgi:hypothetical protein